MFSLLRDPVALVKVIDLFSDYIATTGAEAIVGLEARGFLFGPAIAYKLNLPFVPVRKRGKLPGKKIAYKYDLEYGQVRSVNDLDNPSLWTSSWPFSSQQDEFEMQIDALKEGQKVVIVDDLIATGGKLSDSLLLWPNLSHFKRSTGSCSAAIELIKLAKAEPIECVMLIELADLPWHEKVKIKTTSFLKF